MAANRTLILSLGTCVIAASIFLSFLNYARSRRSQSPTEVSCGEPRPRRSRRRRRRYIGLARVRSCKDAETFSDVCPPTDQVNTVALDEFSSHSSLESDTVSTFTDTESLSLDSSGTEFVYTSLSSDNDDVFTNAVSDQSSSSRSPDEESSCHRRVLNTSRFTDPQTSEVDFQELLISPIVESHPVDERMERRPWSPPSPVVQTFDPTGGDLEAHRRVIYETYNNIVEPLSPNTGHTISSWKSGT